jgi:vancomycin resistance protein YoaR
MRVYGRQRRLRGRRVLLVPAAVVAVAGVALGASSLHLSGHVAGGVSSSGIDLGGLSRGRANEVLGREFQRRLEEPIRVRVNGRSARVTPASLGIRVDTAATVREAMGVGRLRATLFPFGYHRTIQPVIVLPKTFDVPPALRAAALDPVNASLTLSSNGHASVTPGRAGRSFPVAASLRAIALASIAERGEVRLSRRAESADITTKAAERAKARVALMLSSQIAVSRAGGHEGVLQPSQLAPLLVSKTYKHTIGVTFDPMRVRSLFTRIVKDALVTPVNASFDPEDDGSVKLNTAHTGVKLNAQKTAARLTTAGLGHTPATRSAQIAFALARPSFTTKAAKALGITQVVGTFTSDMGDSSPNRIFNVHLMADILNGYQIAPGATFSFNDAVGPRTAERGFLEGQAIEDGLLVPSIGGGVCQVATTVFNAALKGGYPIAYRQNHSFYIDHYPEGLDATVADGGPDFEFTNDTTHTIIVRTAYTDQTMTVSLLSAPTGRTSELTPGAETNPVQPKKRYILDPDLAPGTAPQQQTLGEPGFDFEVTQTITTTSGDVAQHIFRSHYIPEDIVFDVGKGGKIPKGAVLENAPAADDS